LILRLGYPDAILNTTIATLASQTSFTLTAGSADNSAYIGCPVILHDVASAVQVEIGFVSAYTGSTKTVTLLADPGIFTVAAGDNISIMMPANVRAFGGTLVTARDIGASVLLSSGTGTGQVSLSSGLVTLAAVTHTGAVIPTVTTVTNQLTSAAIATGVWQDTTAGDFTVASSIGRSLYTTGALPGAAGGHFIAGTNAATTVTTSFTTTFTGNLTGSVGSVTGSVGSVAGAVGSVTGNVGGNVTGSVGSVATGGITAASIAADAIGASELAADAVTEIATAVLDAFATASDSVQASPAPSTTQFAGSSALNSGNDWYIGSLVLPTSGSLDNIPRRVTAYTGATRLITVAPPWPAAPSAGDTFRIVGRID
jgi:hypothetical protein